MSPHAVTHISGDDHADSGWESETTDPGAAAYSNTMASRSCLQRYSDNEVHDLVVIGFGPASLAIAAALHDALEDSTPRLKTQQPKVRFLERQRHFAWHPGMLLPGAKMQITFIKDLATLRNPRSEFTFLNYLHQKGRLSQFANLSTFLPQRIEYEDYMRWAAARFQDVVDYNTSVQSVNVGETDSMTGAVECFQVVSSNQATGQSVTLRAKHVVIAAGGNPNIPKGLPSSHPRIIHSSQYATSLPDIFPSGTQPRSVAVIGAGQSAAEIFNNIPSRFPGAKAHLLIRGAALRPSDDSPFVNEIFDPERVDDVYSQHPELRQKQIALDRATNYSVVRLELLEHIYETMYSYRLQYEDEEQWPQRIWNHRNVTGISDVEINGQPAVQLQIQNNAGDYYARKGSKVEILEADLVVVASGYRRDAHEDMLRDLRHLMPGGDADGKRWSVKRDYSVEFADGAIQPSSSVWLQGCNEQTHGLADSLLSILANRAGEMVGSIFGQKSLRKAGSAVKGH